MYMLLCVCFRAENVWYCYNVYSLPFCATSQGIKAVIARSYDEVHRSNLACCGVIPLQFLKDESGEKIGVTGHEGFTILFPKDLVPNQPIKVQVCMNTVVFHMAYSAADRIHVVLKSLALERLCWMCTIQAHYEMY